MISEKILEQIEQLDETEEFKKMALTVLEEEDKGAFRFSGTFESIVDNYINEEATEDDKN